MKCKSASRLISRYVDDEIELDEKTAFLLHIQGCPACKERLEETLAVHRMFASAERFSAPLGFTTRVMAGIQEEPTWLQKVMGLKPFFLRAAEVAFALGVLTLGGISGNLLVEEKTPVNRHAAVRESFSLDVFQPAPPDSVGGVYLAYVGGMR